MNGQGSQQPKSFWTTTPGIAAIVFSVAAAYFLWTEHEAHVIAILPYTFLLLCVGMHVFMHGGHGGHRHGNHGKDPESRNER